MSLKNNFIKHNYKLFLVIILLIHLFKKNQIKKLY